MYVASLSGSGLCKRSCKRYKMCKHSDTHMTGNEGCWLVSPCPFHNVWKHVFRDQTLFNFFFFYIVLRSHKCVFSPVYHSQGSKRNTFLRVMLWWVGKEIENVSYHFCRALIFNDSVPCIIYCLRLLLIHDWFGNKQSCHHSCLPASATLSNFWATRHKSLFCVNKVTAMTFPPGWIQAVCKWKRCGQKVRKRQQTADSSNWRIILKIIFF